MGTTRIDESILTFSTILAPTGFVLNPNGTVTLPAGVLPGSYYLHFTLCQAGSTLNCIENLELEIAIYPTVRAEPDVFYFDTQGNFLGNQDNEMDNNILGNDGYSDHCGLLAPNSFVDAVLGGNVTLPTISQNELTGNFSIDSNGNIAATNFNIPVGSYNFTYTLCDYLFSNSCSNSYGWASVVPANFRLTPIKIKNKEYDLVDFNVFPNPSKGVFTMVFDYPIKNQIKIEVYSMIGKKIYENVFNESTNELTIDLNDFNTGSYLLKIGTESGTIGKIIIKD